MFTFSMFLMFPVIVFCFLTQWNKDRYTTCGLCSDNTFIDNNNNISFVRSEREIVASILICTFFTWTLKLYKTSFAGFTARTLNSCNHQQVLRLFCLYFGRTNIYGVTESIFKNSSLLLQVFVLSVVLKLFYFSQMYLVKEQWLSLPKLSMPWCRCWS